MFQVFVCVRTETQSEQAEMKVILFGEQNYIYLRTTNELHVKHWGYQKFYLVLI